MKLVWWKIGIALVWTSIIFMIGCTPKENESFESITTSIHVTEKHRSDDLTKKWLIASNANTDSIALVRIEVENEMVWNLIEENREYVVAYQGSPQSGYTLEQIEHAANNETTD